MVAGRRHLGLDSRRGYRGRGGLCGEEAATRGVWGRGETLRQQLLGHGRGFTVAGGHQRGLQATRFRRPSRTERGPCLRCRHQPRAPGGVRVTWVRQWPDGVWPPCHTVTCWLLWALHVNPQHASPPAHAPAWAGGRQGAGGTEAHSGPAPPAPRRRPCWLCPRRDGSELAGGTGRGAGVRVRSPSGGGRRPRAGPSGWTVFPVRCGHCCPRWTEAGPGPVLGCLRWTAGEGEEKRHPRGKSQPLYSTGKASLHSANVSLVMNWLQRP